MIELYRGIWVVAYCELLRVLNERSRLVGLLLTPVMILLVFGIGFNRMVGSLGPGVDYTKFLFPGVIAMNAIFSSLNTGASIVWDREHGFLKEILVAPIGRSGVVLGKALGGAAVVMLNATILLLLAPIVGVSLDPMLVLKLVPLLLVLSVALSSFGILLATQVRSQQGYNVLMELLQFPLIFLSGTFFPLNTLPGWLEAVSKLNPVTYGVDAIRKVILSGELAGVNVPGLEGAEIAAGVLGNSLGALQNGLIVAAIGMALMSGAVLAFNRQE